MATRKKTAKKTARKRPVTRKAAKGPRTAAKGPRTARKAKGPASTDLGIEDAWRWVDRFCRAMWCRHVNDEPPQSLATAITDLRDEQFLPQHLANMMHTIRSLRNLVVHENLDFGDHETSIARAAWDIVREWAVREEAEAWGLTVQMCERRAA
jgi:hypothetical protein